MLTPLSKTKLLARVLLQSPKPFTFSSSLPFSSLTPRPTPEDLTDFSSKAVALTFRDWFASHNDAFLDQIHGILATQEGTKLASSLSQLGLKLDEQFVLNVLNHGKNVVSCIKFFDWAGRQRGFFHTRVTFNAIFKILSREKLVPMMLDWLETYRTQPRFHAVRFYDTIVVGYAIVGRQDIALKLFAEMRYKGVDLDPFAYHMFLNAMVEHGFFDVAKVVFGQIRMRGLENEVTSAIMVKSFCKQDRLDDACEFLHELERRGKVMNDTMVGVLLDAYFRKNQLDKAYQLMETYRELGKFSLEQMYGVWIKDLVRAGKLDEALHFLQSKKLLEGYIPDVLHYNILIYRLLKENRLDDTRDLLIEMMEVKIVPDNFTLNAALCFFCKAGMVAVVLELYKLRSEFGLSLNSLAYNYLINTLCGDGNSDEAYQVLKDSIKEGYFPGKRTYSIIVDTLCREGKLDKTKDLLLFSLELKLVPSDAVCTNCISTLCKAGRVEDGYLIYGVLSRINKVANRDTYVNLIHGFNNVNRGDMAANVLIEMQENGHKPTRRLYRDIIRCICNMDDPDNQFFKMLQMQLSSQEPSCRIYNFFIDGAGHAKRPDLAREVHDMMARNGAMPNNKSKLSVLQSHLKSGRISDALNYYYDLCKESYPGRKINNTMVIGLSKVNKPSLALEVMRHLREKGFLPSMECYEQLVLSSCSAKNYDTVVEIIIELLQTGRPVSSFICNALLLHSFKSLKLYQAWERSGLVTTKASPSGSLGLGELVGLFSGYLKMNQGIDKLEDVIELCFPPDIFTYNMLLRRLSLSHRLDCCIELFDKICKKGYQPNNLTYDIIVHGLCKLGRRDEAMRWIEKMRQMGFELTESTRRVI